MAHVRDSDTSLWLHNKLGTSNDLWSGGSICSQLNQDVLRNIRECFIELQPQVKLKLLLSFLHIPRRNVEEWKIELEEILEVALVDSDQWVSMLAELLKSYPSTGLLNFQIEENASVFTDVVNDLKKLVRKHSDQVMLPLECLYLNRTALASVVGQLPQPVKHFALKQKPKSATLRAELLQKSLDAANNSKKNSTAPSVPIRCRGLIKPLNDATPLRGIPSRVMPGGFKANNSPLGRLNSTPPSRAPARTPAGRKDGGIKLLEIDEQPMGYGRDAKRRKKLPEVETPDLKKEKEGATPPITSSPSTPDYAAGLLTTPQISGPSIAVIAPGSATPTYVPPASTNALPTSANTTPTLPVITTPAQQTIKPRENFTPILPAAEQPQNQVQAPTQVINNVQATNPETPKPQVIHTATIGNLAAIGSASLQLQHMTVQPQQQIQTQVIQQPPAIQPQQQVQMHTIVQPPPPAKKGLSLTKEQMQEAQDMFNKSNKVTRPEKALILGFIAGSRDNPCPHLGQIVTIMLSENEEKVQQPDGSIQTMIVETHFQMNYSTGEWKRVKKYRRNDL
ncbi:negative elongation factor A isoform X2 [Parasteatoda tepidariorum]|uniref:negative elongation factor A isoform X2 n=2 Tax=Parasteatoda tepidariorum TaxID=114398 RepID=UPI00077FB001|nr:negative elongation factor A isoform X1 [Parasteatoda tepidariorum]